VGATVETLKKSTDSALGDLGLGLGFVGATFETLQKSTDSALGDLGLGLGLVGATVETLHTNLEALDIETRFNQHDDSLGDLGLGLGLVGVTVETFQVSLSALDTNIDGQLKTLNRVVDFRIGENTRIILEITGTGGQIQTLYSLAGNNYTAIQSLSKTLWTKIDTLGDDTETRFNQHENSLGDLGLRLGLVGITVETLHTNLGALDFRIGDNLRRILEITGTGGQIQTLYSLAGDNYTAIQSLSKTLWTKIDTLGDDTETRFNQHENSLGDLGLGLGLVGVTVETLHTNLGALDFRVGDNLRRILEITGTGGQIQTLYSLAGNNYTAIQSLSKTLWTKIDTLGDDTETRFNQHENSLGDLGLGLGLVGVTVETLHTNLGALDFRVGDNLRRILEITGTGGQIQTLYSLAGNNYTAIQSLSKTLWTKIDTLGDDTETRFNQHENSLGDLGLGLGLVGVTVETLHTNLGALDFRVGDNLRRILEITGKGGQIQTLYSLAGGNYTAIQSLSKTLGTKIDTLGDNTETRFNQHENSLGDLGLGLGLMGVTLETLQVQTKTLPILQLTVDSFAKN